MKFSWRSYGVFLNIFKYVLVVVVLGVIAVTGYFRFRPRHPVSAAVVSKDSISTCRLDRISV